jgi:hypothetical protein
MKEIIYFGAKQKTFSIENKLASSNKSLIIFLFIFVLAKIN